MTIAKPVTTPQDFRGAYCRKYRCLPERFVQSVFWQCIPSQVMPIAQVIHTFVPETFTQDFDLIRALAKASSPEDVSTELAAYRYQAKMGLLRGTLKVSISHERLMSLASDLFEHAPNQASVHN